MTREEANKLKEDIKNISDNPLFNIISKDAILYMMLEKIDRLTESEDCRNCKKWNKCPCGKEGHENGTSIGYSIGECKDYEPCEDAISRQAVLKELGSEPMCWTDSDAEIQEINDYRWFKKIIETAKPVKPKYTDEEIDKAQAVEQAYVDKMVELAVEEVKRPKGKWIKIQSGDEDFPESIVCSRCKGENSHIDFNEHGEPIGKIFVMSKYCPNCGAYMSGGENENI